MWKRNASGLPLEPRRGRFVALLRGVGTYQCSSALGADRAELLGLALAWVFYTAILTPSS